MPNGPRISIIIKTVTGRDGDSFPSTLMSASVLALTHYTLYMPSLFIYVCLTLSFPAQAGMINIPCLNLVLLLHILPSPITHRQGRDSYRHNSTHTFSHSYLPHTLHCTPLQPSSPTTNQQSMSTRTASDASEVNDQIISRIQGVYIHPGEFVPATTREREPEA